MGRNNRDKESERTQIHFLSDVLFVVASLNLKVPSVDLLSKTICSTVVVSDWCIKNLAHGWWVSKTLLVLSEEETDPSAIRCGNDRLLCCLIVGIHASGISIPLSPLMLLR